MDAGVSDLVGCRLAIQISDPWEFGTEIGCHPISVVVEEVFASQMATRGGVLRREQLLLRIEKPFAFNNVKCEFLLASPRHQGGKMAALLHGTDVSINFTRIPGRESRDNDRFEGDRLDATRFGLIGSLGAPAKDAV